MEQQNNSGNGNNTLLVVLLIGVAGIGGYLLYTAGKKTAANVGGTAGINPATGLPYSTTPVRPPTNYGSGPALNSGNNTAGTIGAVGGLLNNIIGLFGKKKNTGGTGGNVNTQGHTLGGGLGGTSGGSGGGSSMWDSDFWGWADEYDNDLSGSGWTQAQETEFYGQEMGHTWEDAEYNYNTGGWDNAGGYKLDDGMGGYDYYDANGNYMGNDDY